MKDIRKKDGKLFILSDNRMNYALKLVIIMKRQAHSDEGTEEGKDWLTMTGLPDRRGEYPGSRLSA